MRHTRAKSLQSQRNLARPRRWRGVSFRTGKQSRHALARHPLEGRYPDFGVGARSPADRRGARRLSGRTNTFACKRLVLRAQSRRRAGWQANRVFRHHVRLVAGILAVRFRSALAGDARARSWTGVKAALETDRGRSAELSG